MMLLILLILLLLLFYLEKSCDLFTVFSPTNGSEPDYNPSLWNDNKQIQYSHNCYSYFLNDINQKLECLCKKGECKYINPQPGHYRNNINVNFENTTCSRLTQRVLSDNPSIQITNFSSKCPKGYYKGALTVHPKYQYHFYRQDSNGYWSHKDGGSAATNKDASNRRIINPKHCNRNYPNKKKPVNYSDFCNFFCIPNNELEDTNMSRRNLKGGLKYTPEKKDSKKIKCK